MTYSPITLIWTETLAIESIREELVRTGTAPAEQERKTCVELSELPESARQLLRECRKSGYGDDARLLTDRIFDDSKAVALEYSWGGKTLKLENRTRSEWPSDPEADRIEYAIDQIQKAHALVAQDQKEREESMAKIAEGVRRVIAGETVPNVSAALGLSYRETGSVSGHDDVQKVLRERREAEEAAERAAKEAKATARRSQIAACVRDWGDESQRERLAEGFLPEEEALGLITEHVLAPLASFALYQGMDWSDLDHDEECAEDDKELSCVYEKAAELDRNAYARFRDIRAAAQEAAKAIGATLGIEPREYTCKCDSRGCDATLTQLGVSVRLEWGALSVSRKYAL